MNLSYVSWSNDIIVMDSSGLSKYVLFLIDNMSIRSTNTSGLPMDSPSSLVRGDWTLLSMLVLMYPKIKISATDAAVVDNTIFSFG